MSAAADTVEPFLMVGQRRRAALERALSERIEAWRHDWSTSHEAIHSVVIDGADPLGHRNVHGGGVMLAARSEAHGTLMHLCAGPEALSGLLGMVGAAGEARPLNAPQSVVSDLESSLAQSLCEELLRSVSIGDAVVDAQGAAAQAEHKSRFLSLVVSVAGRPRLALWLSPRLVELLAPAQPPARGASAQLEGRRAAIGGEPVHVEAVLGDVEVALRDLMQLAEGDVIVLSQQLSSSGHLAMPSGTRVAKIQLGSAGRQRAVGIVK